MWPTILMQHPDGTKRVCDLPSRLLKDRIILVTEEINAETSTSIIAQLLALEADDKEKPITMYINSPGGSVTDGLAIYDIMNSLSCPIITIAVGMAASMAAVLLACGTKRFCTKNATVMIHQPMGGAQGQAAEIEIMAERILKLKRKIYKILEQHSNVDYAAIDKACERDNYLEPEEALQLGLIDAVIETPAQNFNCTEKENK